MYKKPLIIFSAVLLLFIAGCMPFGTDKSARCADDLVDCRFYQGSEGVDFRLENPPRALYFHSSDVGREDGNSVSFDVRVHNRGASDSYGAIFLTGFGNSFYVINPDGNKVDTGSVLDGCNFRIASGEGGIFSNFRISCEGLNLARGWRGDTVDVRFDFLNDVFGWDLPDGSIRVQNGDDFRFNIGLEGITLSNFYHGKILIMMIDHINLGHYGGSEFWLSGDNPEYPGGGDDFKTFRAEMRGDWPAGTDRYNINYQLRSCYAYTTFASPMVCVDPSPYSGDDKVCRTNQALNLGTQGAPIAVTKMEQYNTGRTLELKFTIRNVGRGDVWEVGSLERCSPYYPDSTSSAGHKNVVYLGYAEIEGVGLRCDRREIRLDERGEGTFRCTYNFMRDGATAVGSAYEAPLRMELWYGYGRTESRSLEIRRAS